MRGGTLWYHSYEVGKNLRRMKVDYIKNIKKRKREKRKEKKPEAFPFSAQFTIRT